MGRHVRDNVFFVSVVRPLLHDRSAKGQLWVCEGGGGGGGVGVARLAQIT